jgi:hypothetical protein
VDLAKAAAWHRQVAALAAAADRAGVAGDQLPAVQARLLLQQTAIAAAAAREKTPAPILVPTPAEIATAGGGFGDLSASAVERALRGANQTLDAVDAELVRRPETTEATTNVALRNGLIYGGFAATVLAIQVFLLVFGDEDTLPLLSPLCLVVLPAFAWLGGLLTVGAAFRRTGTKVNRTPRLGAVICLVPNGLLCAVLGLLFLVR